MPTADNHHRLGRDADADVADVVAVAGVLTNM
jgi:hypothetical protein